LHCGSITSNVLVGYFHCPGVPFYVWLVCCGILCQYAGDNFRRYPVHIRNQESSDGIVIGCGLDGIGIRVQFLARARDFSFLHIVQTGSRAHPVSLLVSTGSSSPGGKAARV
jgi:hypothetical protein